jgi:hypothetical protein
MKYGILLAMVAAAAAILLIPVFGSGSALAAAPPAPNHVTVSAANTSYDYAIVNWTTSVTQTGFDVNVSTTNCTGTRVISEVGSTAVRHYNMTSLLPSTTYGVTVTVKNASGFSPAASCVTFTTLADGNFPLPPGTDTSLGGALLLAVIAGGLAFVFLKLNSQRAKKPKGG